jgi:hypothetical protein
MVAPAKHEVSGFEANDREQELLSKGLQVLRERLGIERTVEFIRLVGGARDRFEDLRAPWSEDTLEEMVSEIRALGLDS